MNAWIISIVGVVVLGVLVDVMLPEGNTAKYIKGVFGLIALAVMIAPLPKLFNKEFNFESLIGENTAQIQTDNNFIKDIMADYKSKIVDKIEKVLDDEGVEYEYVIVYLDNTQVYEIDYISICLRNYSNQLANNVQSVVGKLYKDTQIKIYG